MVMSFYFVIQLWCTSRTGRLSTQNSWPTTLSQMGWTKARMTLRSTALRVRFFYLFEYLHEFWGHVRENIDPNPIVINSQDLLDNPERILTTFCELTGLPYHDSLLQWDASTDVIKNWKAVGDNLVYHAMSFFQKGITSTGFWPSKDRCRRINSLMM